MFELLGGELGFNTRTHESKNVGGSMFKLGGSKISPSIVLQLHLVNDSTLLMVLNE